MIGAQSAVWGKGGGVCGGGCEEEKIHGETHPLHLKKWFPHLALNMVFGIVQYAHAP